MLWGTVRRLPFRDAEGATTVRQPSGRVLLVDDEPLVRKSISRYLVAAGYVVRLAVDGLDAIGKLRDGLPALIVSDINMPRMSGSEFLDVVRRRFPQIPVIVISSVPADEIPEGVAADAYCRKDGLGFQRLLEIMSDLARKPPLRTAHPYIDDKPVQARWDKEGNYIIACEDCLRVFSVARTREVGQVERRTVCVHCGKFIQFLVPDGDPEAPARP